MTGIPSYAVQFRGFWACDCQVEWIPAYEHELQRRGLLAPGQQLHLYQLIGFYSGSGNTHSTGGATDFIDLIGVEELWVARQMGADATWTRPPNWDGKGGMKHNHSVLTGCPHNEACRYQIDEVRAGGDGLLGNAPDPGPRPLSGRTWQQGIEWARQQEDDMAQYADQLDAIQKDAARAADAAEKATRMLDTQRQRTREQVSRIVARLDQLKATGATKAQIAELRGDVAAIDTQD